MLAVCFFWAATAFGWGTGHDTVARETLRVLPGAWGGRLRAGEGGKLLLKASHAPDDQSTKLTDRLEYWDDEFCTRLDQHSGKPPVMYRLHAADARCELIRAMARAIRRNDEKALGFMLGCFNHSAADTAGGNHSPLLNLVVSTWRELGLKEKIATECTLLEQSPEGMAILHRISEALVGKPVDLTPSAVYAACFFDEVNGMDYNRFEVDILRGGTPALEAYAVEVAYPVKRTVEALLAAEAFAALPEIPAFDAKAELKRGEAAAHAYLMSRSIHDDALTQGLVWEPFDSSVSRRGANGTPGDGADESGLVSRRGANGTPGVGADESGLVSRRGANRTPGEGGGEGFTRGPDRSATGQVPEIGVLYDPTGFWTRGIVYMANRSFAAQICTTLKKTRKAGLIDIRQVMTSGVPAGLKTLIVPGSGYRDNHGFSTKPISQAILAFEAAGGRLIWIGGNPEPPVELFPEAKAFTKNPAKNPWGHMRGPVAAVEMPGGALVLPDGTRFVCQRPPKGGAGWYWDQLGFNFLPPADLPAGAHGVLAFETKEGIRSSIGYTIENRTFLPAFALFPFIFTSEIPSANPLKLELDAAGAAILMSVVK